jgi:hypothetical protein
MDCCLSELSAVRASGREITASTRWRPPEGVAAATAPAAHPAAFLNRSVRVLPTAPFQGLVLSRADVDRRFALTGRVAAILRRRLRGGSGLMVSEFGSFQSGFAIPGASDLDLALGGELLTDALPVWAQQMLARQLGVGCACRRQRSQRCADARRCIVSLISRCRLSDRLLRHRPPPPLLLPRHP